MNTPNTVDPTSRPRALRFSDLEFRADRATNNTTTSEAFWIAYLKAHKVAEILDEWVGPANWRNGWNLVKIGGKECMEAVIEVTFDAGATWVAKTNIGTPSNFEGEKGLFSDAFKRTGSTQWGAGRDVYSLPQVAAPASVRRTSNGGKEKVAIYPVAATRDGIMRALTAAGVTLDGEPDVVDVGGDRDDDPAAPTETMVGDAPADHPVVVLRAAIDALPEDKFKALAEQAKERSSTTYSWSMKRPVEAWTARELADCTAAVNALAGEEPLSVEPDAPAQLSAVEDLPAEPPLADRLKATLAAHEHDPKKVLAKVNQIISRADKTLPTYKTWTDMCRLKPVLVTEIVGVLDIGELPEADLILGSLGVAA